MSTTAFNYPKQKRHECYHIDEIFIFASEKGYMRIKMRKEEV
jgi:hypothetical protein